MKKKVLIILGVIALILALITIVAYLITRTSNTPEDAFPEANPTEEYQRFTNDTQVTDVYSGSLPCPDCDSVKVTLSLSRESDEASGSGTFTMTKTYLGTEKDVEPTFGTWVSRSGIVGVSRAEIVVLTFDDQTEELYEQVDAEKLIKLDENGNRMSDSQNYTLTLL